MIREPVVAGSFYPEKSEKLKEEILSFISKEKEKTPAIGVVAPHAGYIYSGKTAASVYSRIVSPDTFIILGPNHTGMGKPCAISTFRAFKTPLGDCLIDRELTDNLLNTGVFEEDHLSHLYEHSIEVQIPFLQVLFPHFKIVPICMMPSDLNFYKEVGDAISSCIKGLSCTIIASSDMTHYEPEEIAREKDNSAIDAILKLDEDLLIKRIREESISMCGYVPVSVMIKAVKGLGAKEASLIEYTTSGDVSGDKSSVVGYAGIIVR